MSAVSVSGWCWGLIRICAAQSACPGSGVKRYGGDVVSEHIRDLSIGERRAGDGLGNEHQTCCLLSASASGSSGTGGPWGSAVFAST